MKWIYFSDCFVSVDKIVFIRSINLLSGKGFDYIIEMYLTTKDYIKEFYDDEKIRDNDYETYKEILKSNEPKL